MKFVAIGLAVLLAVTTSSSTETISGWGPLVFMWLLTTLGTWWVLRGEADTRHSRENPRKAA
jgi:hypothetical protein